MMKISVLMGSLDVRTKTFIVENPNTMRRIPHVTYGSYLFLSLFANKFFLVIPLIIFIILKFIERNSDFFSDAGYEEFARDISNHLKWIINTFIFTITAFILTVIAANFDQEEVMISIMICNSLWVCYRIIYGWRCFCKGSAPVDIFQKAIKKCTAWASKNITKKLAQGDLR